MIVSGGNRRLLPVVWFVAAALCFVAVALSDPFEPEGLLVGALNVFVGAIILVRNRRQAARSATAAVGRADKPHD